MPSFYLGIDGGQSSTTALISDETGRVLGTGKGGPCNHVTGPEARSKFLGAMRAAIEGACQQAKIDSATIRFAAACLGLSGGAEDKRALVAEAFRSQRCKITHDAEIALSGALAGAAGIVVIAGTGSIAFGRNETGLTARAGGWGYVFGDEGGAFDLVRQALRAALRFEEGWGPETALRGALLEATGSASANELLHKFYNGYSRHYFAALAPLVTSLAAADDPVAIYILNEAAEALVALVQPVFGRLFTASEPVPVAFIGGVFTYQALRDRFAEHVLLRMGCRVQAPRYPPAAGALIEALRTAEKFVSLSDIPLTMK